MAWICLDLSSTFSSCLKVPISTNQLLASLCHTEVFRLSCGNKIGGSQKFVIRKVGQCWPTTLRPRGASASQTIEPHLGQPQYLNIFKNIPITTQPWLVLPYGFTRFHILWLAFQPKVAAYFCITAGSWNGTLWSAPRGSAALPRLPALRPSTWNFQLQLLESSATETSFL